MTDGMRAIAVEAGIKVAPEPCDSNIVVTFTADPGALVREIGRRGPFIATLISASNHHPFRSPEPELDVAGHDDVHQRIRNTVRYTDDVVEELLELRGDDGRIAAFVRSITEPGVLADTTGYAPDLTYDQKVEILETLDVT